LAPKIQKPEAVAQQLAVPPTQQQVPCQRLARGGISESGSMASFERLVIEARDAYCNRGETTTCIICGSVRSKKILSHIVPNSFYKAVLGPGATLIRPDTGSKLPVGKAGFVGFCATCESLLNVGGESMFARSILDPLVADIDRQLDVQDTKPFFCLFSVIWRILALSPGVSLPLILHWLDAARTFLQRGDVPPSGLFRLFLWVPTSADVKAWNSDEPAFEDMLQKNFGGGVLPIPGGALVTQCFGPLICSCVCSRTPGVTSTLTPPVEFWLVDNPHFRIPNALGRRGRPAEFLNEFKQDCERQRLQSLRAGPPLPSDSGTPILALRFFMSECLFCLHHQTSYAKAIVVRSRFLITKSCFNGETRVGLGLRTWFRRN